MPADSRPRRLATASLTVALALLVAGCVQNPNSVFHSRTDFNRDVTSLFNLLIWLGTIVFIFTEGMLLYALWRYRSRPDKPRRPEQVRGNTRLEILWTVIPAVVLAIIAVPTVQTIFKTQSTARADAVQVEVIGHQWWWEFRYPQYNVTTANEVYLPIGRTVNFALKTQDVLHSFWIPALGGKRDLVNNRTNYLWFTPDSTTEDAFNGFCAEFCGLSHANMRFKAFTVTSQQFASWIAHQQRPALFTGSAASLPQASPQVGGRPVARPGQEAQPQQNVGRGLPTGVGGPTTPSAGPPGVGVPTSPGTQAPAPIQAGYIGFSQERMPHHAVPQTPIPPEVTFDATLTGDPASGARLVATGACIACHTIKGIPSMMGKVGPDLTHVGSRLTIAGGLFPNDTKHLAAWIKNSRALKPGVFMNTLGKGQYDPILKTTLTIGLTDQQIADIVAYLQALK
jgi:cytochrome c oxidase subunit 2